jgi:hypothetical protein
MLPIQGARDKSRMILISFKNTKKFMTHGFSTAIHYNSTA